MIYFTDAEIDQLISEDLPYYDLTSHSIKMGSKIARISFTTRHETLICGTEEAVKIFEKFKINPTLISISGENIAEGVKFLEGEGLANDVHLIWRTVTNLMEYASGIATRMKNLNEQAQQVNHDISIVTTRKSVPFTKKIAVKAIHIGGGNVHRLGLSDTILIFDNHIKFLGGIGNLILNLPEIKQRSAGRNISIEVKNSDDALTLAKTNINILQLDKFKAEEIKELIPQLRKENPTIKIAAAGNIDINNIQEYATSGVDMLVTSSPYYGKPADFMVNIEPRYDL